MFAWHYIFREVFLNFGCIKMFTYALCLHLLFLFIDDLAFYLSVFVSQFLRNHHVPCLFVHVSRVGVHASQLQVSLFLFLFVIWFHTCSGFSIAAYLPMLKSFRVQCFGFRNDRSANDLNLQILSFCYLYRFTSFLMYFFSATWNALKLLCSSYQWIISSLAFFSCYLDS